MSLSFSPWGFLHLQIILKLLCSPEITSWGEARVATAQVKARLSSPLSQFLTPQGNKLLCAIWGTRPFYQAVSPKSAWNGWCRMKAWTSCKRIIQMSRCICVLFLHSLFIQSVTSFMQSIVHWRKTHSLILSYSLSWSKPSGVSLKYCVTTVLCATSQPMLISPCAVKAYLAQSLAVTPFYNAYHWYARTLYSQQLCCCQSLAERPHSRSKYLFHREAAWRDLFFGGLYDSSHCLNHPYNSVGRLRGTCISCFCNSPSEWLQRNRGTSFKNTDYLHNCTPFIPSKGTPELWALSRTSTALKILSHATLQAVWRGAPGHTMPVKIPAE